METAGIELIDEDDGGLGMRSITRLERSGWFAPAVPLLSGSSATGLNPRCCLDEVAPANHLPKLPTRRAHQRLIAARSEVSPMRPRPLIRSGRLVIGQAKYQEPPEALECLCVTETMLDSH